MDGLKTSAYLIETAKNHIEGKISITEADERINSTMKNEKIEMKLKLIQGKRILFQ